VLLAAIDAAESAEDLRSKLAEVYGDMSQGAMQTLAERAQIMAALAGRHAVLEDL
jgi:hypothetical protein